MFPAGQHVTMSWVLEQTQPHAQPGAEMPWAERQKSQTTTELTGALPTDHQQQTLAQH